MSLFSEIEKSIERGFRRWTERMFGASQADDLVTLHHAILEEIEGKVEVAARGLRVFPYAHLVVTLMSADPELTLPHPRAHERAFVLVPWTQADPAAVLPGRGPAAALLADLDQSGVRLRPDLVLEPPA